MFSISPRAMTELALMLAEGSSADGEQVMRMEKIDGEICMQPDERRPEDVVFALQGPWLLCISKSLVAELGERRLDFRAGEAGARFCVVD
ncbi:MAG: hypothetical protein JRI23_33480 [Deltaproteobacteria bacterium]|jgi:hypothetical protein|nr:hypothetical protein [Deltaproteobacteria bacterium]MBW2537192.1 hypothetical protein [Deltaproteobacteria bacterium]